VLLKRIDDIRQEFPFTLLIPTLDLELEQLINIQAELKARGVSVMLPDGASFRARTKQNLPKVADHSGVLAPHTFPVYTGANAAEMTHRLGGKAMIKGPFYDASKAESPAHAAALAGRILAEWGGPVLVQELIVGEEYDLLAVGDGKGGTLGSCSIRKLVVSSRGKGYAGITVDDEGLREAADALMKYVKWRGPWECEFIRNRDGQFYLIEINPRFPAWADFPAAVGANLVAASVLQVLGESKAEIQAMLQPVPPGKVFLRHSTDLVCDAEMFRHLVVDGHALRSTFKN
jgi:carbamoyl-phosphate synthase large subunit